MATQFDIRAILSNYGRMITKRAGETGETLDRALTLFAGILEADGARTLREIADDMGLPSSTAHRFVAVLLRHDMIVRIGRGRYCMAYRLAGDADEAQSRRILARLARPAVRSLARATRANVHLGVLDNDMVTYLVKEGGRKALFTEEGMQLEAYCSAVGKVLLANLPSTRLDAFLDSGSFVALTPSTIVDPVELRHHLMGVRAARLAFDEQEFHEDLRCAAVPITSLNGRIVAALSISCSPPVEMSETLLYELRHCAAEIEGRLCHRPPSRGQ